MPQRTQSSVSFQQRTPSSTSSRRGSSTAAKGSRYNSKNSSLSRSPSQSVESVNVTLDDVDRIMKPTSPGNQSIVSLWDEDPYSMLVEDDKGPKKTDEKGNDTVEFKQTVERCRATYMQACKDLNISPEQRFDRLLFDPLAPGNGEYNSSHVNNDISDLDIRAIGRALPLNFSIHKLVLTKLGIGKLACQELVRGIVENRTIQILDLSGNHIGNDEGSAMSLAKLLKNRYLWLLNLSGNRLPDKAGVAIAENLAKNESLRVLDVTENEFAIQTSRAFGRTVRINNKLRHLAFGIWDKGIFDFMARYKQKPTVLNTLRVTNTSLSVEAVMQISEALETKHMNLTNLDLSNGFMGDKGAISIAWGLKDNRSLVLLGLKFNGIADAGAVALSEALKRNHHLTEVDLSSNSIADTGGMYLAQSMEENKVMSFLNIGGNQIGVDGGQALLQALSRNTSVTNLGNLETLPITVAMRQALYSRCSSNVCEQENESERRRIQAEKAMTEVPADEKLAVAEVIKLRAKVVQLGKENERLVKDYNKIFRTLESKEETVSALFEVLKKIQETWEATRRVKHKDVLQMLSVDVKEYSKIFKEATYTSAYVEPFDMETKQQTPKKSPKKGQRGRSRSPKPWEKSPWKPKGLNRNEAKTVRPSTGNRYAGDDDDMRLGSRASTSSAGSRRAREKNEEEKRRQERALRPRSAGSRLNKSWN